METYTINHITKLVEIEICKYYTTIKAYAQRVSTWKDPNTCETYYKKMNNSEDFIDLAITFLAANNKPLKPQAIARYEKYQELRAQVIG